MSKTGNVSPTTQRPLVLRTADHTLESDNFLECMLALQDQQIQSVWTGNLGVVNVLGQRRNALAHGHRLAKDERPPRAHSAGPLHSAAENMEFWSYRGKNTQRI